MPLRLSRLQVAGIPASPQPVVVRAVTPNNDGGTTLWFAYASTSSIIGINTRTKQSLVYPGPNAPTLTVEIAQGQSGNIWASHTTTNSLEFLNQKATKVSNILDPGSLESLLVGLPATGGSWIFGKDMGLPPGRVDENTAGNLMYYTRFLSNKLIRLELSKVQCGLAFGN